MFSLKRGTDEDVDSLIESMLRLIEYMNQNPAFKRDIFKSFSAEDLNKILKNMEDSNIKLRKVSSLFLCSILTNQENCDKFCQMLDMLPVQGKLSVTPIPDRMVKILTQKPKLLNQINSAFLPSHKGELPFCWYYTIQMARDGAPKVSCFYTSQLKDIKNFFYEFADPAESLIGVIYTPSQTILSSITTQPTYQLSTTREQQLSPSPQSMRKSIESYRPNSVQIPQQALIKSRYGPLPTEQSRKSENGMPSHSPIIRQQQSTSPQQQFSKDIINVKVKIPVQKPQNSTPVSSYTTFLNAQRLKIENTRYTSDKQRVQKNNQFDFLRHRLSDNMSQILNKSNQQQSATVSASQNYPLQSKVKQTTTVTNTSFNNNIQSPVQSAPNYKKPINSSNTPTDQSHQQDWKSIAMTSNYGITNPQQDWRSSGNRITKKSNVGKVRIN